MKTRIITLFTIIVVAGLLFLVGCSKEQKSEPASQATAAMNYVCPMHPEVVSKEPGNCPICNMQLVPKEAAAHGQMEQMADIAKPVYTCPMHPEVVSDKPGVCPECNMNLELKVEAPADTISQDDQSSLQQYTCGMHPQIVTNEPGLCPICHMKLVPKSDVTQSGGVITVNAQTQKNMGVATSQVTFRNLAKSIRAYGNVTYSEPKQFSVNIKFPGWVEKLYVNKTGSQVSKGDPVLEIYSPELIAAQQEYLIAWRAMMAMHMEDSIPTRLVSAAISKLKNWDINDEQIQQLALTKQPKRTLIIYAPYDGIVTEKNVREGDNVMAGQELFKLADLSTVWVSARVYEQDLPFIHEGQTASVSSPSIPGESFRSSVIYVSPFLDESRQAEIRLSIGNASGSLKPNMYAEVDIKSELPDKSLAIPRSAVIKTGTREIVFVALADGQFQGRDITTGVVDENDFVEIKSGLHDGEFVVTSGQFMLDSESRLHEAIAGMGEDKSTQPSGHVH